MGLWAWTFVIVVCLLAGIGAAYLLIELGAWLESRIDDEGNWQ